MSFPYMGNGPFSSGPMPPHMHFQMNRLTFPPRRGMGLPMGHPGMGPVMQGPPIAGPPIHGQFLTRHLLPPLAADIRRQQNSPLENFNYQAQMQQHLHSVQNSGLNNSEKSRQQNKQVQAKKQIAKSVSPLKTNQSKNQVSLNLFISNIIVSKQFAITSVNK